MKEIHIYDPLVLGTKGLVFVGDKILVYRRDTNTNRHPLELDIPGGGAEGKETPYEMFERELKEEFGLDLEKQYVVDALRYPATVDKTKIVYFLVVRLPAEAEQKIVFGDEGVEYMLMTPDEYLGSADAWKIYQDRIAEYLASGSHK